MSDTNEIPCRPYTTRELCTLKTGDEVIVVGAKAATGVVTGKHGVVLQVDIRGKNYEFGAIAGLLLSSKRNVEDYQRLVKREDR